MNPVWSFGYSTRDSPASCSGRGLPDLPSSCGGRRLTRCFQRGQSDLSIVQQATVRRGGSHVVHVASISYPTDGSDAFTAQDTDFDRTPGPLGSASHNENAEELLQENARRKTLKINVDLALYRARMIRMAANRTLDYRERMRLYKQSEAALEKCLELAPDDGRPYVSLGKLHVQHRRYEQAAQMYERGQAATFGTNAHIWAAWAYLAGLQGDVAKARRLYDAAIVADPAHAAAWHGWGLLEKQQGNDLRAKELWLKGLKATDKNPNSYLYQSLAVLCAENDAVEEARKWFMAGTRTLMGAQSHALWQAWALMEQKKGDTSAVRYLYRRGLEASPRSRYLYLAWALWEKECGNRTACRKLLAQGHELNKRDPAILQAWAVLEQEDGNLETARNLFETGSRADRTHLYIWQAWGVMEYKAGNLERARELFQQGVWAAPPKARDVALVFQAWAVLERDANNIALARELFKCAVKANPRSEPSWMAWAQMEEAQGMYERANELRNFSMQERVEIQMPKGFSDADGSSVLAPIFAAIKKWTGRYDKEVSSRPLPRILSDDEKLGSNYSDGDLGGPSSMGSIVTSSFEDEEVDVTLTRLVARKEGQQPPQRKAKRGAREGELASETA